MALKQSISRSLIANCIFLNSESESYFSTTMPTDVDSTSDAEYASGEAELELLAVGDLKDEVTTPQFFGKQCQASYSGLAAQRVLGEGRCKECKRKITEAAASTCCHECFASLSARPLCGRWRRHWQRGVKGQLIAQHCLAI